MTTRGKKSLRNAWTTFALHYCRRLGGSLVADGQLDAALLQQVGADDEANFIHCS